jgi:hypothetical protein
LAPNVAPAPTIRPTRRPPARAATLAKLVSSPHISAATQRHPARASASAVKAAAKKLAAPRHGAEVGLGTTVLGVLGLVVLPISLVGLLIGGGPVWAVLAVLAALAVLIAYLDPFN